MMQRTTFSDRLEGILEELEPGVNFFVIVGEDGKSIYIKALDGAKNFRPIIDSIPGVTVAYGQDSVKISSDQTILLAETDNRTGQSSKKKNQVNVTITKCPNGYDHLVADILFPANAKPVFHDRTAAVEQLQAYADLLKSMLFGGHGSRRSPFGAGVNGFGSFASMFGGLSGFEETERGYVAVKPENFDRFRELLNGGMPIEQAINAVGGVKLSEEQWEEFCKMSRNGASREEILEKLFGGQQQNGHVNGAGKTNGSNAEGHNHANGGHKKHAAGPTNHRSAMGAGNRG